MIELPRELRDFIEGRSSFVLMAHEAPDADAIGAQYAFAHLLRALGKSFRVFNADPPPPKYAFIDQAGIIPGKGVAVAPPAPGEGIIVFDTNDLYNLGPPGDFARAALGDLFVIDHHEPKKKLGCLAWILSDMSSTSEMVYALFKAYALPFEKHVAEALFTGMVFDTGSFIYAKTTAATLEAAADLVRAGVGTYDIHMKMYESASIGALKLETTVLARLALERDDRIAFISMSQADIAAAGAGYDDAEGFINFPLKGRSVEVSVFVKEKEDGSLRCSLRSKGGVNVSRVAQAFGGGGHRTAAGFRCRKGLEDTRREVIDMISKELR